MNDALKILAVWVVQVIALFLLIVLFEALHVSEWNNGYFSGVGVCMIGMYLFKRYIKD